MVRRVKRLVYLFGCWLAVRANRLEGIANDLQDWGWQPAPRRDDELSKLIIATLINRGPEIADSVTRNNALLRKLTRG